MMKMNLQESQLVNTSSTTMATDALKRLQTKARPKSDGQRSKGGNYKVPTPPRENFKTQQTESSLFAMLNYKSAMYHALSCIEAQELKNSPSLPFPVIQWDEDDSSDDYEDLIDEESSVVPRINKGSLFPISTHKHGNERKHCLRRSLACWDHLSLLDMDYLASRGENYEPRRKRHRMMSCPL